MISRTAFWVFLPITFISSPVRAAYKWADVRLSAEKLLLKNNRASAQEQVIEFLSKNKDKAQRDRAIRFLNYISSLFLSEKAHKTYFLGQSLFFSEPHRAKEKFLLAKTYEPLNEQINKNLIRLYFFLDDCKTATREAAFVLSSNPYSETMHLLALQGLYCQSRWEDFAEKLKEARLKFKFSQEDNLIIKILDFKSDLKNKEAVLAVDQLYKRDGNFPLALYWKVKAVSSDGSSDKALSEKYLSICQKDKAKVFEKYEKYPFLCSFVSDMENHLR